MSAEKSKFSTMSCPFCEDKIKESVFAESENFRAIYNLAPILPGHSLVIPKKHTISLLDLSDMELSEMIIFAKKVTQILLEAFNSVSFNWSIQDSEAAGQTVSHLHLHIVPRYTGDLPDPGDWYPKINNNLNEILDSDSRDKLSQDQLEKIVAKLKRIGRDRV
jgi:bis(5'-adenosyl)-triphosphatase